VTVDADDLALPDLGCYQLPRFIEKLVRDVELLIALGMVELQNYRIALAAVNAGMQEEIVK
jgi:hypothetical protein